MWKISEHTTWPLLEKEFDWVNDMKDVPQDAVHHAEGDVATHTCMVLKALDQLNDYKELQEQDRYMLWAAALLHDVEKRSTTVLEPDGSITSRGHAKKGAVSARNILYRSAVPFHIREQICSLVRFHGLPLWSMEKTDPVKAVIQASLQVNTKMLALLARADILGRHCSDKEEMLYKIELFQALCEENNCWNEMYNFSTPRAKFHYFQKADSYPEFIPFDDQGALVVLMSGLPGAGKDRYVQQHYKDWPVISLDEIRKKNRISPTDKSGNGTVIQLAKERAREYLRIKKSFVWNATNITRQMRDQLIQLFSTYKAFVRIVYIESPYNKLHHQNNNREAVLPHQVIEKLINKLELPVADEAHEIIYHVRD